MLNLTQGSLTVAQYFTKLKALWEEMSAHRPSSTCVCGGLRPVLDHLLHDFAAVRGQILLMEPLPPINKVYSLVTQEERQRAISHSGSSTDPQVVFAAKILIQKARIRRRIVRFAHIAVYLVTQWISASSCMVIHLATSLNLRLPLQIRFLLLLL